MRLFVSLALGFIYALGWICIFVSFISILILLDAFGVEWPWSA